MFSRGPDLLNQCTWSRSSKFDTMRSGPKAWLNTQEDLNLVLFTCQFDKIRKRDFKNSYLTDLLFSFKSLEIMLNDTSHLINNLFVLEKLGLSFIFEFQRAPPLLRVIKQLYIFASSYKSMALNKKCAHDFPTFIPLQIYCPKTKKLVS